MISDKKKEIVRFLIQNNVLVDKPLMSRLESSDLEEVHDLVFSNNFVFSRENFETLLQTNKNTEENTVVQEEKNQEGKTPFDSVKIISVYKDELKKKEVSSFVKYFNARYHTLRNMLLNRAELTSTLSIKRILEKKERETVSTIGIVYEKETSKSGNIVLTIEDPSGSIKAIVNKDKKELFEIAKNLVYDEVIGVSGMNGNAVLFLNSIVIPDVPLSKEFKKSKDECYAVVLSDLHVGSTLFLEKEYNKFIEWISGKSGNESQKRIAEKVKYVFVLGDLVDGVGIYPSQRSELNIEDIYKQYDACAEYLKKIPSNIPIMIIPGNHDAMRLTEPQPTLYKDYAKALWEMPNAIMLTNPAYVNIHESKDFPGFDFLLYHGYSFDYFADTVESIRQKRPNISDRSDLVQKFLLQRRHLAPSHTATLYVQDTEKDPLIIDKIPDFFLSGHIHKAAISSYRNITLISGSCFQAKTPFQEKVGHEPEPCRVPVINLQTREVKMFNFSIEEEKPEQAEE